MVVVDRLCVPLTRTKAVWASQSHSLGKVRVRTMSIVAAETECYYYLHENSAA
jgi:hypothetical protein